MSATVSEVPSDEREVLPKPNPTLKEHPVLKLYENSAEKGRILIINFRTPTALPPDAS